VRLDYQILLKSHTLTLLTGFTPALAYATELAHEPHVFHYGGVVLVSFISIFLLRMFVQLVLNYPDRREKR